VKQVEPATKTFVNEKLGLTITLPSDWIEEEEEDGTTLYLSRTLPEFNPNITVNRLQLQGLKDAPEMHRHYADATHAARDMRNLQRQKISTIEVSGYPATDDLYTWEDDEFGKSVIQRTIFVQLSDADLIYVFTCTYYPDSAVFFRPVIDAAIAGVQIKPPVPATSVRPDLIPMSTKIFPALKLSLTLPLGWKIGKNEYYHLLTVAPPEPGTTYPASIGLNRSVKQHATVSLMDNLMQHSHADMLRKTEGYRQLRVEKLKVDGQPARLRVYERKFSAENLHITEMQFLWLPSPDVMFTGNANCLQTAAEHYLRIFEAVFRSAAISEITSM
jgi:hypothetical protein